MEEESDLIVLHKGKDLKVKDSKEVREVKEEDSKAIELPETLETQEWT